MKRKVNMLVLLLLAVLIYVGVTAFRQAPEDAAPQDWRLILVNADHAVPEAWEIALTELTNGQSVDSRIYPDLQAMFDAARAEGLHLTVSEGYRTHEEQQRMMDERVQSYRNEGFSQRKAEALAREWVAAPGHSEHELGLAVDINAAEGSEPGEVYDWLYAHAHEYGFILRYPIGKTKITGIDYEPWHYRYVGCEAAQDIRLRKITLEEYLEG